jgi:putative tryptophan/tyrosine transport system substrate-binding protein
MNRRAFVTGLGAVLAAPLAAEAQQMGNVWRIGYLRFGVTPTSGSGPASDPFLQGLRDLGYVEGRNLTLEIRYAEGRTDRFSGLAAELVGLKIDALVVESTPAALAARQATSTTPIVMLVVSDPVGVKLVDSLAHPGGNVTGLSIVAPD